MTPDDFWRAVGEQLLIARERRSLKPSHMQKLGGPHYDTVQDIERGEVGNVEQLERYAAALNLSLVDVFRTVLKTDARDLSPEEQHLLRTYATTTLAGRRALVATAEILPTERPPAVNESRGAAPPSSARMRRGRSTAPTVKDRSVS